MTDLISLLRRTVPEVLRKTPFACSGAAWIDAPLVVMSTYKKAQADGTLPIVSQSLAKIASCARGLGVSEVNIVFDGPTRKAKLDTVATRAVTSAAFLAKCPQTYSSLLSKDLVLSQTIITGTRGFKTDSTCTTEACIPEFPSYSTILKNAKFIAPTFGNVFTARHDAEEHIALMMRGEDIAITVDSDALAFGCTRIVQHLGKPEETWIQLAEVLEALKLTQDEFRTLCVFLGNDFNPRIRGAGPVACLAGIRAGMSIESFASKHGGSAEWIEKANDAKSIFSLKYA